MNTLENKIREDFVNDFQMDLKVYDELKQGGVIINIAGIPYIEGEIVHQKKGFLHEAKLTRIIFNPSKMIELLGEDTTREELAEIMLDIQSTLNYSNGQILQEL